MTTKFNFSGLHSIYREALNRNDPTLVFEVENGQGKFVFMMFFSKEDKSSKDRLFIHLRNINRLLELKIYGSHWQGDFTVYLDQENEDLMIEELQLNHGGNGAFVFQNFLDNLNTQIPHTLPLQHKLNKIREVWPQVQNNLSRVIDAASKTTLIGVRKVPKGKSPRDKTLRKLYIHTNGNADTITEFINALKRINYTVAWTDKDIVPKGFAELMAKINA